MSDDGRRHAKGAGLTVLAALLVVTAATVGLLVVRGLLAKEALSAAVGASASVSRAISAADLKAASSAVRDLEARTATAESLTGDPIWRVAEIVPVIGENLTAVRVASAQAHSLARDVAAPLLELATSLKSATGAAGSLVDLTALADGRGSLTSAAASLQTASSQLKELDTNALLPQLRDGIAKLDAVVTDAGPAVSALSDSAAVLPGMLGATEPRTILVMLQNNAELRTGGGITGTFILLRADHGALSIVAQADSSDFHSRTDPILPIDPSTTALYGDVVGRFVQNTSIPADFDVTARLASSWWSERYGVVPDAVIAADPLVLQSILRATGPVPTSDGPLSADNAVDRLLIQPYRSLDGDGQTAVFQDAATAVFSSLTAGGIDPIRLVQALGAPATEGRISVWSAHPDEEAVLKNTTMAGPAARQRAAGADAYAVYLNDATGAKMDTYLKVAIASGIAACRPDGLGDVQVSVTLTNTAPADAGSLPVSVTGGGAWGVEPGHIATTVSVSAPAGSFFGSVSSAGAAIAPVDVTDAGFQVSATEVDLAPGQSRTIDFRFISASSKAGAPIILHTPLVDMPALTAITPACD